MKEHKKKKGVVLISTMLLLTVIIMTGIMLAISAYSNMKISRGYKSVAKAQYAAESGTEYIRSIFYKNADFMYHKKNNDKGSVNKKTLFLSQKNSEEMTVTIDYENRWIKGTLTERNGEKTFFRAGFCDSTTAPKYPLDDDKTDNLPPIKYLSCNNFPSDRYGNTFELLNDKYIARETSNGRKTKISPNTAYLVVEGISNGHVKYIESYLEKVETINFKVNRHNNRLEYGMTEESSIFTTNIPNHQLSNTIQKYASLKENIYLYSNLSSVEEEKSQLGKKININLNNLKNNQIGKKINAGAYFIINDKIYFIPENKLNITKNGNFISNLHNATLVTKNDFFSYNSINNEIKLTNSIICNGNLIISNAEYSNNDIISKKSDLKISISNSKIFVNGEKCIIKGEILGEGMIYSTGEIEISSPSFPTKNKKNYPLIIANNNITVQTLDTDSIFNGYEKFISDIWENFINAENNILSENDINNYVEKLLKTKANMNNKSIDLETSLKNNLKYTSEEAKYFALSLIELNSEIKLDNNQKTENTEKNPEKLYGYKIKSTSTINLYKKIKNIPLKNEMILFADLVSIKGDVKTEKGMKLTIFGIVEIYNKNNIHNKMFFKYLYNPNEKIFISEGKGVKTRYKFRNIF